MAMFEQMRANVGKLLKGIDRSEPGRRSAAAARRGGRDFVEAARGGRVLTWPGGGFPASGGV